jgi:heptaprenyl diphosphate synthase
MDRQEKRLKILGGMAVGVYVIENLIPKPLPWFRIGLSNSIILCILTLWGVKQALGISVIRTIMGSIFSGVFLTPFFFFGMIGGIVSVIVMWVGYKLGKKVFSLIGISILGATAHNLTQLCVGYFLYIKVKEIFYLLPIFILLAPITGLISGIVSIYLKNFLLKLK